ncbi:Gfo/Idh/MocA family protein [Streptomyces sp. NPDC020898]|uniref:Gfo/Idh/MocA family protein n=1 Tax=Streptomyces sp. NPDC020898 TaxID=3365101 RepID=UPI003793A7F9
MRVGIVGAGNIASAHMRAVQDSAEAELVGLHDIDEGRALATAAAFGCRTFRSAESLYRDVDAVVVASPNHTHAKIVTDALHAGRHVLCEKPMAVSTAEAQNMVEAARRAGLSCGMGFNYRFLEVVQRIRGAMASGQLGTPLLVQAGFRRSSALTRSTFTWRDGSLGRSTSGALGDLGIHLIDLLHFLFRSELDTTSCVSSLRTHVPEKEGRMVDVDDHAFVAGRLDNGVYVQLTASKSAPLEEAGLSIKVVGTRGEFVYHSRAPRLLRVRSDIDWRHEELAAAGHFPDPAGEVAGWADSFRLQFKEWTDMVVHGKESGWLAGFEDGLRAQRVLGTLLDRSR